jgi:hypothetical protein
MYFSTESTSIYTAPKIVTLAQVFVSQFGKVRESPSLHSQGMSATCIALAEQSREREGQTA